MNLIANLFPTGGGEQSFYRMPVSKSIYRAIRDFFDYFSSEARAGSKQVVAVSIDDTGMEFIGFVTQTNPERLPEGFREQESVLVYLPVSYMIRSYAVLTPHSAVRPVEMNLEEAMRFTLTAGITGKGSPLRIEEKPR